MTISEHEKEQKDLEIANLKDEVSRLTAVQSSSRTDASGSSLPSLPPPSHDAMLIVPLPTVPVTDKDGKETAVVIATHAFLTHAWGSQSDSYENHRRVAKIYRILEKNYNMKMWFDEVYLNDNIRNEITQGVKNALSMLVFITKEYDRKISGEIEGIYCQLEFEQGFRRFFPKGRFIPIIMEEEMLNKANWSSALEGVCGGMLYFDFSKMNTMSDDEFSSKCKELFEFIMKKLSE
jgi:hypothetical protein